MAGHLNPLRAPKSLPILISSKIVKKGASSCEQVNSKSLDFVIFVFATMIFVVYLGHRVALLCFAQNA